MSQRKVHLIVLVVGYLGLTGACVIGDGDGGGGAKPDDDAPVIGASAGGETNIISDGWELASVRGGNNLKMMNFAQMQSEVLRATSVAYDNWAQYRLVFGAADFRESFQEDRTPTATKVLTWRKIAFSVCASMVTKETTRPVLFASISPTANISSSDPRVVAQVRAIFTKFFFEPPTLKEVDASTRALVNTVAAGGTPSQAWSNLCVAYLSSMRFLTY